VWEVEQVATIVSPSSKPVIAVDSGGAVHVLFYDFAGLGSLQYATKATPASSWVIEPIDTAVGTTSSYVAVLADPDGALQATYYEQPGTLHHARKAPAGGWAIDDVDTGTFLGTTSAIDRDATGELHISYRGAGSPSSLRYAHGTAGNWAKTTVPPTGPADPLGGFSSIRVDAARTVHVSTLRDTNGGGSGFELVYATLPLGGSWLTTTIQGGGAGQTSELALDEAGGIHIAYLDGANMALRYAYKPAGGAWSTIPIDTESVMPHQSLRIDRNGVLHVVYINGNPFGGIPFRVRHATATIGGAWTTEPVGLDTTLVYGASLVLGPQDSLHVAYLRDHDVRYAHHVCHE